MPRQTSLQLTEATERQVAALRSFGTFTDVNRIAIDRMYRDEIISNKRPILYTYISDRWGNEQFDTTLGQFRQMCQEVFEQAPELWEHQLDGYWVVTDEKNEVVLSTNPKHLGK